MPGPRRIPRWDLHKQLLQQPPWPQLRESLAGPAGSCQAPSRLTQSFVTSSQEKKKSHTHTQKLESEQVVEKLEINRRERGWRQLMRSLAPA